MIRLVLSWLFGLAALLLAAESESLVGGASHPAPAQTNPSSPGANTITTQPAAAEIIWHAEKEMLEARIPKQNLSAVLPRLAQATGWRIFVEPGTDPVVGTTFRSLPAPEALERLLGNQSFALQTPPNGQSRLLIYRTTASGATEEVPVAGGESAEHTLVERVGNELLVKLKPDSKTTIEELAAKLGAKIVGKIEGLDIYRLRFPDQESTDANRLQLKTNPEVAAVGDNLLFRGPNPGDVVAVNGAAGGGGLSLTPAKLDQSKLIIGLIDTPVRSLGPEFDRFLLPAQSVVSADPGGTDLTHGTAMLADILHGAQVTLGAGQEAAFRVLPVNVYDSSDPQGRASLFDVLRGSQVAIQQGASIINWSLGSSEGSPFAEQFTKYYSDQGVAFLAAAGNQPTTANTYPAAYTSVTAITAINRDGNFASYANRGSFVDVGLPGSDLVPYNNARYLITGTSTATAFGSGMVAARTQMSGGKPAEAVAGLIRSFPPPAKP